MDILLLERLVPEALAWLESRHSVVCRPELANDPIALRKAVYNAQAVVLPRKVVVTQEFLDFAPLLKAVARMHVGTDNTDLEACRERKVRVIQASTANVRSNAEYLLAGLLLLYRRGIGSSLDRRAPRRHPPGPRTAMAASSASSGWRPRPTPLAPMLQRAGRASWSATTRPCTTPHPSGAACRCSR